MIMLIWSSSMCIYFAIMYYIISIFLSVCHFRSPLSKTRFSVTICVRMFLLMFSLMKKISTTENDTIKMKNEQQQKTHTHTPY